MSECRHGEWGIDGECVKCGEHYTDAFEALQQQVDKLKQDALEDAEWAEACDVRNDTLQQQVESLKGALADAVQRCGYGDAEILRLRAEAQEKDNPRKRLRDKYMREAMSVEAAQEKGNE
jgi:hypothetical protein